MGTFKRSLDVTQTGSLSELTPESILAEGTPPKNWYKDLKKYNESLTDSHISQTRSTRRNVQLNNMEKSISKDLTIESDSDKLPTGIRKINLMNALKLKNNDTTTMKEALEDESTNSEVVLNTSNNLDSEMSSSESSYTRKMFKTQKPKKSLKLKNFTLKKQSGNPFKKFLEEEDSSSELQVSNSQGPQSIRASKNIKFQEEKNNSPDTGENSVNKTKSSIMSEFDKSSELNYSEKFLKKRKPRTLTKIRNVVSKSTEDAFKQFFDDDSSSDAFKENQRQSMDVSSRRKSSFRKEEENVSANESITSHSRKGKTMDFETSRRKSSSHKEEDNATENESTTSHSQKRKTVDLESSIKQSTFRNEDENASANESTTSHSQKRKTMYLESSIKQSTFRNEDENASANESMTSHSRKEKTRDLETSTRKSSFHKEEDNASENESTTSHSQKRKTMDHESSRKKLTFRNEDENASVNESMTSQSRKGKIMDFETSRRKSSFHKEEDNATENESHSQKRKTMDLESSIKQSTFRNEDENASANESMTSHSRKGKTMDLETSTRKSGFRNKKENASANESITSYSRKRKTLDLETSHNSPIAKKKISSTFGKSSNSSHSPSIKLKYTDKSNTFTQSQKEKSTDSTSSPISNEDIRLSKNESRNNRKSTISPVEDFLNKSTTESTSNHSIKGNTVSFINEQSATNNSSESEIDVVSQNEESANIMKNVQLNDVNVLKSVQGKELINIVSQTNRHSISDTNTIVNSPRRSSRLNKSIEFDKQSLSNRLSHFIEEPQFESTRKIDFNQLRRSPRKRESIREARLSNIENANKDSGILSKLKIQPEKYKTKSDAKIPNRDLSDEDIQVTNTSLKNKSNIPSFEEKSTTNEIDDLEHLSKSKTSKDIEDIHSEKSLTVSLSEGESHASKTTSDESIKELSYRSSQRLSTSFTKSPQKNLTPENENTAQTINSKEDETRKPKITNFEILKSNAINLNKLKGNKQTDENEANLERSDSELKTLSKRPRVSTIEEEFSQMHGIEDEQVPSTSDGRTHNSQNRSISVSKSLTMEQNSSLKSLRKTLESEEEEEKEEEEEESELSENPLLSYYREEDFNEHNISKENRSERSLTSPMIEKNIKHKTFEENKGQLKQKNIKDFFEPKGKTFSSPKLMNQNPEYEGNLMTVTEIMNDKKKLDLLLKILSDTKAKVENKIKIATIKEAKAKEAEEKIAKSIQKKEKKEKKPKKPIHSAYLVNGKVYKQPKLPRPMPWATDRLYKYIEKQIEPKYGMQTRIESGEFVIHLSQVVKKTMKTKLFKNYEEDLETLKKHMAKIGLIVNYKDFIDFVMEYLPTSFRLKVVPMLLPGNRMNIPYDKSKLYTPIKF
ncbi:dentin sialophosphoprotein-like isoform X2 [Leptopilina boulardi]|nr:dentin sialophosphoprotein-like isoform X2 [Leptopilina boulardi]